MDGISCGTHTHTQICASRYNTIPYSVTAAGQHVKKLSTCTAWALHSRHTHCEVRQGSNPPTHNPQSRPFDRGINGQGRGTTGVSGVVSLHASQGSERGGRCKTPRRRHSRRNGGQLIPKVTNSRAGRKRSWMRPACCSLPALLNTAETAAGWGGIHKSTQMQRPNTAEAAAAHRTFP